MTALDEVRAEASSVPRKVVIVGAGQAGGRCAEALRAAGFAGEITLVGRETHLPYERPALSKELLTRKDRAHLQWVRPPESYAADNIALKLGLEVVSVDRLSRRVILGDGSELDYDVLILTTGARPRRLNVPGADAATVHYIRTIEDSESLAEDLAPGARVVVIGGGFIGLEVAAAARQSGASVKVLEATDRLMGRAVPPEISDYYFSLHETQGVSVRLKTSVASLELRAGATVVTTLDGEEIHADVVVAGIGIEPNDELARSIGLLTDRGIVVDAFGRTSDPNIFAAGDVARHFNPLLRRHILLESWQNAQNQAIAIAKIVAGGSDEYAEVPWFWTDQFGINLQVVGLPEPAAKAIVRGTLGSGPCVVLQMQDGRIVSACAVGAPRDLRYAKQLIASGAVIDEARLASPDVRLMDVAQEFKQAAPATSQPN